MDYKQTLPLGLAAALIVVSWFWPPLGLALQSLALVLILGSLAFALADRRRLSHLLAAQKTFLNEDIESLRLGVADFARGNLSIQAQARALPVDDRSKDLLGQAAQVHNRMVGQVSEGIQDFNSMTFTPCERLFYVGTDLYLGGQLCGETMGQLLGGQGEVAIFMKKISVQSNNLRRKGFTNGMARKHPKIRIVEVNEDNEDIEANYRMTKELIRKYPGLRGIYITIGNTPQGTARAVEEAGKAGQIRIVCHDLVDATMTAIERGVISATLSDSVFAQAYDPVVRLHNFLTTGQEGPVDQYLSILEVVTQGNCRQFWNPDKGILISDQVAKALVVPVTPAGGVRKRIAVILPSKELYWKTVYDGVVAAQKVLAPLGTEVEVFIPEAFLRGDWQAQALEAPILEIHQKGFQALALPIFDENLIPFLNTRIQQGLQVATFLCEPANLRGMLRTASHQAGQLSLTTEGLTQATNESRRFITELNRTMVEFQAGMDRLQGSLGETRTILDRMSDQTEVLNTQTAQSVEAARETRDRARTGFDTVTQNRLAMDGLKTSSHRTNEAMDTLNTYTMQIRNIVSLIEDIAEKTNVLAINAAIEAARAGTVGRGFNVVATEIKTLSQESKKATGEISDLIGHILEGITLASEMIGSSVVAVENTVQSAAAAGSALEQIIAASRSNEEKIEAMFGVFGQMRTLSEEMRASMQTWMNENAGHRTAAGEIAGEARTMDDQVQNIDRMVAALADMAKTQKDSLAQFIL